MSAPAGHYLDLLRRIHRHLRPRTYVEIGVGHGQSLALADPGTISIGVDPDVDDKAERSRSTRLFRMTSDAFFARHNLGLLLDGRPVDLAFIDGMHLFEFALRDFINLERWCSPNSIILVHDCLPHSARTSTRRRRTDFWSGDVWKLPLCLGELRPQLEIAIVNVAPTGLAIVGGLNPRDRRLQRNYADSCERYIELGFDALGDEPATRLGAMPNDWAAVRALLTRLSARVAQLERRPADRPAG